MENEDFKYDPEAEDSRKKYALPFGLCKSHGIEIKDWWTPKDAWEALRRGGIVDDVSEEYQEYYRNLKKEKEKERRKMAKERNQRKQAQLSNPLHTPDKNYVHKDGAISGAAMGTPMDFEQANGGKVNPYFKSYGLIGYHDNCQTCVAAYYARRMGYDVQALPNLNNRAIYDLSYDESLAFIDKNGNRPKSVSLRGKRISVALDQVVEEGKIYALDWRWGKSHKGHIVAAERINGQVMIYDPQSGEKYTKKNYSSLFQGRARDFEIMPLSGCALNEKFCDKIFRKAGKDEQK